MIFLNFFVCNLLWIFHSIYEKSVNKILQPNSIVYHYFLIVLLCSFIIAFIFSFSTDGINLLFKPLIFSNILGLAITGGVIPDLLMAKGQQYVPSHVAGLIYNFEAVFAVILSVISYWETRLNSVN